MRSDTGDHEPQPSVTPHLGHNPVREYETGEGKHVRHQEQGPGDQGQLVHLRVSGGELVILTTFSANVYCYWMASTFNRMMFWLFLECFKFSFND